MRRVCSNNTTEYGELRTYATKLGVSDEQFENYMDHNGSKPYNMKQIDLMSIAANNKEMSYGRFSAWVQSMNLV